MRRELSTKDQGVPGKTATMAGVLLVVAAALGQQAPKPHEVPAGAQSAATEGGITKFSINSQLVIETVSVVDKNGKPIEGLKAEDFKVTENGVPQTIKFCEFQKLSDDDLTTPATQTSVPAAP